MPTPQLALAQQYARERLESDLPTNLRYHSVAHTFDDVLPAAERLAAGDGVSGLDLLLLKTAALYHDVGFVARYVGHEQVSIDIAQTVLPSCGYTSAQIAVVVNLIRATHFPQTAMTKLEQIMADADLDVLGRKDFFERNELLRLERISVLGPVSLVDWYQEQLTFIERHDYFSVVARALRNPQKQANTERLREILNQHRSAARHDT